MSTNKKKFIKPTLKKIDIKIPPKFCTVSFHEVIDNIDGIEIKEIVSKFGSPVFVFSENTIIKTYNEAYRAFSLRYPKVQFAWSYKTNYLGAICKIFHKLGCWAEVVSDFEYEKAISLGIKGENIIFNGPYKTEEILVKAIKNNSIIHIDHFDEFYQILEIASKINIEPKVAIRINMDTGIYPQWVRFGFNYENGEALEAIKRIIYSQKINLVGLHTHIGTYIMAPWAYYNAAQKLVELAAFISKNYNITLNYIDIGGGFASKNTLKGAYYPGTDTCPSFEQYADAISSALLNLNTNINNLPTLILETGRALIDDAGYLITTIIASKKLPNNRNALIIDAGINSLFTSFWYNHDIVPTEIKSSITENFTIYGPLCMNIDVIREEIKLPPLKKGDLLVIKRVGAYNVSQWLQFITYRPPIVLIDKNKKIHLIRKKEDLNYLTNLEIIPDYLKD